MKFTFKVVTTPECGDFLKIKAADEPFQTIDVFVSQHTDVSESFLSNCVLQYRGREIAFDAYEKEYADFANSMEFVHFARPAMIVDSSINAAAYYTHKAIECLQFARFFIMKSALLLDTNENLNWKQGYIPQFYFRCIYFGTASTWLSNAFDHVLQSIYWGLNLFTSAKDRNDQPYDASWDTKKILENCTYEFVVGELKARGLTECRKHLTGCSSKIEEVRKWANYIKHKGGIDYKYLEAESPMEAFFVPIEEAGKADTQVGVPMKPDERFKLKDFKSPVEVDIDEKISDLVDAHKAIFDSITETIADIDYNKNSVKFGGEQ